MRAVGFDPMNQNCGFFSITGTDWTTVQLPPELEANRDF